MLVQKMIIQGAVKLIAKQFKLDKILHYVEEPNELDKQVERLTSRVEILETIIKELSHIHISEPKRPLYNS